MNSAGKDKNETSVNQLQEENCQSFSVPNDREFFTPLYPKMYPNNTECILRLNADFGYLIKIDFRDYFEMEPSEGCQNDYLEVRDGPHGYSDLIGKYCGVKFPPIIISKDRHMWLRFSSDETLQYRGFRAVFEFIKNTQINRPEIDACVFNRSGVEGLITHANIAEYRFNYSLTYSVNLECIWYVEVAPHQKIYLYFESFKLAEPNECQRNYVEIYGDQRDVRFRMKRFCGSVADNVVTSGNKMYFRYFAIKDTIHSEFRAWFTAFREWQNQSSKCLKTEYDCDDTTCIDSSLRCNGIKNCKLEYDEKGCKVKKKKKFDIRSEHIIIILTLGCGLLAGIFFAACYDCVRKLIKDGQQIHENIRRSREQLEEGQSESFASSPKTCHGSKLETEDVLGEGKRNGHTYIHAEEDTEVEEEDDEDFREETCVEIKECECQSRGSRSSLRDSGHHGTPPPPPPPTKRPPGIPPPLSPIMSVPTPPPPPVAHPSYYSRHHPSCEISYSCHTPNGSSYNSGGHPDCESSYGMRGHTTEELSYVMGGHTTGESSYNNNSSQSNVNYESNDLNLDRPISKCRHSRESHIQMKDRQSNYEVKNSTKTTPDVLVSH